MTVNERIKSALTGIGLPVKPDRYKGAAESYIVFNCSKAGALFADDMPVYEQCLVQIHLFCPMGQNMLWTRSEIKRRLYRAGFTWPSEVNAADGSMQKNDETKQHYVFECAIEEGVEPDGWDCVKGPG